MLTIVILNWNTRDLLLQCLEAVHQHAGAVDYDILVVDNASSDGSLEAVQARYPHVAVWQTGRNAGFAAGNNAGVARVTRPYALLLNTDAFVQPGALAELLRVAEAHPQAGVVGAHLRNADGSFQASHTRFPTLGRELLILSTLGRRLFGPHYPSAGPDEATGPRQVDYVEGACLLVRVDAYRACGGLDEGFFMYAEEVDLCRTMHQHGYEVWYAPQACVTHLGGGSSQNRKPEREADLYRSRVRYFRKHHGAMPATALKALLVAFTLAKYLAHSAARALTGGRVGRRVVSPATLLARLRHV